MGKINGKIYWLMLTVLIPFAWTASAQDDGTRATLTNFKLPEYSEKDGKLKFIIYGKKAVNLGAEIDFDHIMIDIIKENIGSIDDVKDMQSISLYPIDEKNEAIENFWKDKGYSQALISSPKALYDKTTRSARGNEDVHFRSQMMDIDGVGFDVDYDKQIINVKKDVKVVIRSKYMEMNKKPKIKAENSEVEGEKSENKDKLNKKSGEQ